MGPVLECFDKERVCDSQDHVWSRERERKKREEAERGLGEVVCESGKGGHALTEPVFLLLAP